MEGRAIGKLLLIYISGDEIQIALDVPFLLARK
jgi:hypothetical protein